MPKAPRYSRRPPVPAHSPAHPSVPFTLPRSLPTQAGRAATDVSLFDPRSARVRSVATARLPPVPAHLSPTTPPPLPPLHGGDSWGPVRSRNTDGQTDGGRRATWYAAALSGCRRSTAHGERSTNSSTL